MKSFPLLICLFPMLAFGRLGELPRECEARYGAPQQDNGDRKFYHMAGLLIMAEFFEGHCETLMIGKAERDAIGRSVRMSEEEVDTILEANRGSLSWKLVSNLAGVKTWQTQNGERTAQWSEFKRLLLITTKEQMARAADSRKEDVKERLKGF
ncbi:MAG TPA: hypothetical protein VGE39_00715 [Prosthecobacter sp.]